MDNLTYNVLKLTLNHTCYVKRHNRFIAIQVMEHKNNEIYSFTRFDDILDYLQCDPINNSDGFSHLQGLVIISKETLNELRKHIQRAGIS